jgi:hypothetical protein
MIVEADRMFACGDALQALTMMDASACRKMNRSRRKLGLTEAAATGGVKREVMDTTSRLKAHRIVRAYLERRRPIAEEARKQIHLVSYPRSGNTLVRRYLSILQGRQQSSVYPGDVVDMATVGLTRELDRIDLVKIHRLPPDENDVVYIVRDGRNATLSFVYLNFLAGGHNLSRLDQAWEAIRQIDESEGSWGERVGQILQQADQRRILFVRYEDLVAAPQIEIVRIARFVGAELSDEAIEGCLELERGTGNYVRNPLSGYLYEPDRSSIYDLLQRHRKEDYWRYIFDHRCRRHFHERGGTEPLMHFGYEQSSDWWKS